MRSRYVSGRSAPVGIFGNAGRNRAGMAVVPRCLRAGAAYRRTRARSLSGMKVIAKAIATDQPERATRSPAETTGKAGSGTIPGRPSLGGCQRRNPCLVEIKNK
jgi:hypothetical protein